MPNGWGLIPWGTGQWGLTVPPAPIPPAPSDIHIIDVVPTPGAFNILRNQTFTFTIKTRHFALNPNNTYIFLDDQTVVNGAFVNPNFAVIATTNTDGISVDYQITPNYLFRPGSSFTLQVYATDIHGNPSFPFWAGYVVFDDRPPLITPIFPIDRQIEVPLDLTLHFLINQLIAPDAGLKSETLNISVDDLPAVIDGVIQPSFTGIYSAINLPGAGDITTPFEIILDYLNRYNPFEIITVSASAVSIIEPITDTDSYFLNQYGLPAQDNFGEPLPSFSVTNTLKINDSENQVTLNFGAGPNQIADGYIQDGYQLKNFNGNTFHILGIIDGYNILVETLPKTFRGKFTFLTAEFDDEVPTPIFAGYFQGIYLADNLGDGYHINLVWHPARTSRPDDDLAYLIFYSTSRADVFEEEPKLITQGKKLPPPETVAGADAQLFGFSAQVTLPVGVTFYFGVRATEYPHSALPVVPSDAYQPSAAGLKTSDDGVSFIIPTPQILRSTVSGSGAIVVPVLSTTGFPTIGGYITVGGEIMRYTSLTGTSFIVASNGRGLLGTLIQSTHAAGQLVRFYGGNFDDNTVIAKNVVTWESPNDPHRFRPDLITTDMTLEDAYNVGFEPFDYCGYHRQRPDELFSDQTCGTYVGGEFNGHRGLFLTERLLANEEQLLEVDGESVILLERLWQGETCLCRTSRKDSARVRSCAICFGTGFKGGYTQYRNPRRNDQRIRVHFSPNDEDFGMGPQSGWEEKFKPNSWTLKVPTIKDRDVLVRFDQEDINKIQWFYVVNTVSRGETVLTSATRQRMNLSRIDKTDVINTFRVIK